MLLKMLCRVEGVEGDERLFYEWKKIGKIGKQEVKNRVRIAIAFVRSLPKWENCVFLGFERDAPEPDTPFRFYFRQSVSDVGEGKERKRMLVESYVEHQQEETITRDEFCQIIDEILKCQPEHIRKFFKDMARDPETDDTLLNWTKDQLLEKYLKEKLVNVPIN